MKECMTCFTLWCKRILKRPLFLFTLLLMPCTVLFLQNCQTKQDSMVRVALYTPCEEEPNTANQLISHLQTISNRSISFYRSQTKDALTQDVSTGKASCGYIIPNHLDDALRRYAKDHKPFIKTIRPKKTLSTNIVDEIVLSKLYQKLSYYVLETFLEEKTLSTPDETFLTELFERHSDSEMLFQFEYADGTTNTFLNDKDSNYMLMPIRGIIAVLILLSCMAGGLLWYIDAKKGLLLLLEKKKQQYYQLFSLLVPGLLATVMGLATLYMVGVASSLPKELLLIIIYLVSCISLVHFLRCLFVKREYFLASLPLLIIGSLILCPVFIDVHSFSFECAVLSKLLPATYYLDALHDIGNLLSLILYSVILTFASVVVRTLRALLSR